MLKYIFALSPRQLELIHNMCMVIEKIAYKNYNVYVMGNITNESSPYYILYIIISPKKGNLHTALFRQIVKIDSISIGT